MPKRQLGRSTIPKRRFASSPFENSDAQEWEPRHANNGRQISSNQMRAKITAFLATSDMTRTKWVDRIGVQSDSVGTFRIIQGFWSDNANGFVKGQLLAQAY